MQEFQVTLGVQQDGICAENHQQAITGAKLNLGLDDLPRAKVVDISVTVTNPKPNPLEDGVTEEDIQAFQDVILGIAPALNEQARMMLLAEIGNMEQQLAMLRKAVTEPEAGGAVFWDIIGQLAENVEIVSGGLCDKARRNVARFMKTAKEDHPQRMPHTHKPSNPDAVLNQPIPLERGHYGLGPNPLDGA